MKDAFVLVFVSILFFACTGPTAAQEIELIPELKNWEPLLGKWNREMEARQRPLGTWYEGKANVEIRSGGFFVEIHGRADFEGEEVSWIEIIGYDPVKRGCVSSSFASAGGRDVATSQGWDGTTLTVNFTRFTPDRKVQARRRTWEYSSDFKSVTLTGETFANGKWWVTEGGKGTKVE